jgi:putative transposase
MRRVDVLIGQSAATIDAIRQIGVTEQTDYCWRKQCGGMGINQLKELKLLQKEDRLSRWITSL